MYGSDFIGSLKGLHQNYPLGPMLFSLTVQQLISSLHSELDLWYLDDGTIGGDPSVVLADLKHLTAAQSQVCK